MTRPKRFIMSLPYTGCRLALTAMQSVKTLVLKTLITKPLALNGVAREFRNVTKRFYSPPRRLRCGVKM